MVILPRFTLVVCLVPATWKNGCQLSGAVPFVHVPPSAGVCRETHGRVENRRNIRVGQFLMSGCPFRTVKDSEKETVRQGLSANKRYAGLRCLATISAMILAFVSSGCGGGASSNAVGPGGTGGTGGGVPALSVSILAPSSVMVGSEL